MAQLTILIVDDDNITASMLSTYADTILTASDSIEGLKLFQEHHPDIILSDINMPRMD